MKMEHYLAHTDYPIWEVIQNRNGPVLISTDTSGQIKVLPPRTAKEIVAREKERKARTTLLMALPEDYLAKFHKMTDAKEMRDAIKSRFGGNDESKKMQKFLEQVYLLRIIDAQRKFLAQQRSEAIRNRPPTKNQLRNQMMTYLKHVGNFMHAKLKIKKFEEVQALYEKIKRSDVRGFPKDPLLSFDLQSELTTTYNGCGTPLKLSVFENLLYKGFLTKSSSVHLNTV
ncbi:hypothetical protein Tco_0873715 [Tanacetum coccineum]|uniref:Uncharacterized protein n=1 Tax=Tanacetum coccineum TaxID=301880 RepID=A0ABQ5BQ86_9ASTR